MLRILQAIFYRFVFTYCKCFIDYIIELICSLWMLIKGPCLSHIYSSGECQARWMIWTHARMILPSLPLLQRSHALAWRSKLGCLNNAKSQQQQPLRAKITYSVHLKLCHFSIVPSQFDFSNSDQV
jgi:hypothetical protein